VKPLLFAGLIGIALALSFAVLAYGPFSAIWIGVSWTWVLLLNEDN